MKEDNNFELVAQYLGVYIRELTKGKKETFLAITDISSEVLPDDYIPIVDECILIRVMPEIIRMRYFIEMMKRLKN